MGQALSTEVFEDIYRQYVRSKAEQVKESEPPSTRKTTEAVPKKSTT